MNDEERVLSIRKWVDERIQTIWDVDKVVQELQSDTNDELYYDRMCSILDTVVTIITEDYIAYPKKLSEIEVKSREIYKRTMKSFVTAEPPAFYSAVDAFFENRKNDIKESLFKYLKNRSGSDPDWGLSENELIIDFVTIFKNAYSGFWNMIADIAKEFKTDQDVLDECLMLESYFKCKNSSEEVEMLLEFAQQHQSLYLPKELLANGYYCLGMWNNALAYYEQIENECILLLPDTVDFRLAFCYGHVGNREEEETHYRRITEYSPYFPLSTNNLGYSLYIQGKYEQAKEILEKGLKSEDYFRYTPGNLVRTLIGMGRLKEARKLVDSGKYKIAKCILGRLERAEKRETSKQNRSELIEPEVDQDDENEEAFVFEAMKAEKGDKDNQFFSEKILEDELTGKIESGQPVFGLNLKIWKRKGEYGRQFIIPNGKRLDLLCEDDNGDIYIIELKKDSGYDDPYDQTAEYVDWFEKWDRFAGRKIQGIICLNTPTKKVLDKVHKDNRIRLFEYQISYNER